MIKDHVLRLTYTAHDVAPFARDMGYVKTDGRVKPPIVWNEADRRHLRRGSMRFISFSTASRTKMTSVTSSLHSP